MTALARRVRPLRHDRYVLFLTAYDYRFEVGGLERYVRDEMAMLAARGTSAACLFPFPTQRSRRMQRWLSGYWGVVADGRLVGFYETDAVSGLLAEWARAGQRPLETQIHHLRHYDPARIQGLLADLPVPVKLFLHDYYTVCPQYNLLKNGERYCGEAKPSPEKCRDCSSWTPPHHGEMRALFESVRERLTIVAPSESAQRIWLSTFPDFAARTVVVPHLKPIGEAAPALVGKNPAEPIRWAFLGAPYRHKGWETFRELARQTRECRLNCEFIHFGRARQTEPAIRHVSVSFVANGADAMTAALRQAKIDVVLLWALWPETYSYTLWESWLAQAMVVTNPDSGNIAHMVASRNLGLVLRETGELMAYARDPDRVRKDLDSFRRSSSGRPTMLVPNDEILGLIDFESAAPPASAGAPARKVRAVGSLYQLKRWKKAWASWRWCAGREG